MTPERARELAEQTARNFYYGQSTFSHESAIHDAILVAIREERARCIDICEKDLTQTAQKIANVIRGKSLENGA